MTFLYPPFSDVASLQQNHSQLFTALDTCFYDFCIMFVYFVFSPMKSEEF